ncbi:potassium voltage-gated channel, subfamily H (eag-related), member 3, partial [Chelydra serpentina]
MFGFQVGPSGPDCSSPSPGPESRLHTIPLGAAELTGADAIEKLRQAVAELSGQVLQMREGLQTLRQALQLFLLTQPPAPLSRPEGTALLQPLRVETGIPASFLHSSAPGPCLNAACAHTRPAPPWTSAGATDPELGANAAPPTAEPGSPW